MKQSNSPPHSSAFPSSLPPSLPQILVALPNVVGVLLGFLQLALRAIYPAHAAKGGETAGATVTTSSSSSSSSSNTSPVNSIAQTNPIAMSRKLSMSLGVGGPAAKHLLVRREGRRAGGRDGGTEGRRDGGLQWGA